LRGRIEAHICIAFAAYTIYKELEQLLSLHQSTITPARAAELTHTMYELEYILPGFADKKRQLFKMDSQQQLLYSIVQK
jgi:hypothetical protein